MQALETALDLLKQLDALRPISADQEQRIWQKFRLDWNYHSNKLEGNSLTFGETKSLILHGITAQGKPLQHHFEITGHNEAINEIHDAVKKQLPLTETFLRQLHELILKQRYQVDAQTTEGSPTKKWVEVGQYKTQPNHVLTQTREIFRFAEPFEVPAKMHDLLAEGNTRPSSPAEGLLLAAKLHYQFVLIHPFDDGNGRMARILMNLVLMQSGFPPAIIKTEAKEAYLAALRLADGGQFEIFAEYIAERVCDSLKIMIAGAKGEVIDEPDDLDKKILLLKGLIDEAQGTDARPLDSTKSIQAWIEKVVIPLFAEFVKVNDKLKVFYLHSDLKLSINGVQAIGASDDLIRHLQDAEPTEMSQITMQYQFHDLKIKGIGNNDRVFNSVIYINAEPISYRIEGTGLTPKTYRYDSTPSETDIDQITKYLSSNHLEYIEARRNQVINT
jgi:Fic family protein